MPEKTEESRRRSARLKGYDYSQPGAYFVTICTQNKEQFFEDKNLSAIVENCWTDIPKHFPAFDTDAYVVMPNHLHGIILIHSLGRGEAFEGKCLQNRRYQPSNASPVRVPRGTKPGSLEAIVQNFKSVSTRRINQLRDRPGGRFWQRGYYDHIIRNREELDRIRKYISENPLKWELDEYYPPKMRNA